GSVERSLIEGWMSSAQRYAAEAYGSGPVGGVLPAVMNGPDGKPAVTLPLTSFALIGAPLQLSVEAPPILTTAGEVYVPLRPYAEAMRYRIEWDAKNGLLRLTRDTERIELRLG